MQRIWTIEKIPDQKSTTSPAIASYGGFLHMVHLGEQGGGLIWHSFFDGSNWITPNNQAIPEHFSLSPPALASDGVNLHMVHRGRATGQHNIYHSRWNGSSWDHDTRIQGQLSKEPPAIAYYYGLTHMVHLGDSSNKIWYSTWREDEGWDQNRLTDGPQLSKASPALSGFPGKLYMVHLGDSSNNIWCSEFNRNDPDHPWFDNIRIENQSSKKPPAIADIHMVHNDSNDNRLWYTKHDGSFNWLENEVIADLNSDLAPALTIHNNQLHMVYVIAGTRDLMHAFSPLLPEEIPPDGVIKNKVKTKVKRKRTN